MKEAIAAFIERLEIYDGFPPLSEAKIVSLSVPDRVVVVEESHRVVALGVVGVHPQSDGSVHSAVETAVEPSMRFHEFEARVLDATLDRVSDAHRCSVWSRRRSLDAVLSSRGWESERTLLEMVVGLPVGHTDEPMTVRPFNAGDEEALVRINGDAFGDHREAGSLDLAEVGALMRQPWFDRNGVLFHEVEGEIAAFCWTKVHPNGEGEIYRIGVGASHRGLGIGKAIVVAGFEYLASARSCGTGFLWVDASNEAAMRLYTGIGMTERSRNIEFACR